jgi:hypothetical protein
MYKVNDLNGAYKFQIKFFDLFTMCSPVYPVVSQVRSDCGNYPSPEVKLKKFIKQFKKRERARTKIKITT